MTENHWTQSLMEIYEPTHSSPRANQWCCRACPSLQSMFQGLLWRPSKGELRCGEGLDRWTLAGCLQMSVLGWVLLSWLTKAASYGCVMYLSGKETEAWKLNARNKQRESHCFYFFIYVCMKTFLLSDFFSLPTPFFSFWRQGVMWPKAGLELTI